MEITMARETKKQDCELIREGIGHSLVQLFLKYNMKRTLYVKINSNPLFFFFLLSLSLTHTTSNFAHWYFYIPRSLSYSHYFKRLPLQLARERESEKIAFGA